MNKIDGSFVLTFVALILLICACDMPNGGANNRSDSVTADSNKSKLEIDIDSSEEGLYELDETYNAYIRTYKDTICVDTLIFKDKSRIQIDFCHFCRSDSSVHIPPKYTKIYNIDNFVTHNFVSNLKVKVDDICVVDTIIGKSDFVNSTPEYLRDYGVLLYPKLHFENIGRIEIKYSLSIPLTEVGKEVIYSYTL
ncbi:hypothetical protein [Chitinophaga rhizophila]|uniref:Uncharacterized protein n=1 Tax=Chitinophaga rhizophila TaxID=2866212 RepID=A0ABS7GAL8_9BACT|nr:hypothetical protein [Chitinophaga rhizophila]MBW8684713.1 hypothetical protein [Chitinophaga rhizophila]